MKRDYIESRIVNIEPNGKLAQIKTVRIKNNAWPGQFFIAWVPGIGEEALPVANIKKNEIEFLIGKNSDVQKKLFNIKKRGSVLLRGPYGNGFPVNNIKKRSVVLIGQTSLFSPLWSAFMYIKENRKDYKNISLFSFLTKPKKAFVQRIKKASFDKNVESFSLESSKNLVDALKKIKTIQNTIFFLSMESDRLKELVDALKKNKVSKKNIYIYLHRKIRCGVGICGSCAVLRHQTCSDGPVFLLRQIERFL